MPRWERLGLPDHLFAADQSEFETEINQLRTHQGQSDVYVINPSGTILAPTFGGGANSLVTEVLGDDAIISSDFGGNPPYEKMKEVARICFKHWLAQSNVLFIIGGKSNNTDIFTTFRAMGDALARAFQHARPDAALRRGRPRRAEPDPRHGRPAGHGRGAGPALPLLRLRFGDQRGRQLRPGRRPLDEGRRPRAGRAAPRHRARPPEPTTRDQDNNHVQAGRSRLQILRRHRHRWPRSRHATTGSACSTSWAANPAT